MAILVAIGMFRASGAMGVMTGAVSELVKAMGFDSTWVEALPTALMKPLSGTGSRGLMVDVNKSISASTRSWRVSAGCITRQHRHYVLYSCRVLRQRGREKDALCSPVRADG